MHTWKLLHEAEPRFVELTACDDEVELTCWSGQEPCEVERHRFAHAEAMKEFVEEWLEQLALDGYVQLEEGAELPDVKRPAPQLLQDELAERVKDAGSLGQWLSTTVARRDAVSSAEHPERDDDDAYDHDDLYGCDIDELEPDFEVRSLASLSVDEAFDEPIKEHPYDVDPEVTGPLVPALEDPDVAGLMAQLES